NETWQYYIVGAIDFVSFACQFVFRDLICRADRDDLSISDEHGAVFDDAQLAHLRTTTRASVSGRAAQSEQLRGVDEKHFEKLLRVGVQEKFFRNREPQLPRLGLKSSLGMTTLFRER